MTFLSICVIVLSCIENYVDQLFCFLFGGCKFKNLYITQTTAHHRRIFFQCRCAHFSWSESEEKIGDTWAINWIDELDIFYYEENDSGEMQWVLKQMIEPYYLLLDYKLDLALWSTDQEKRNHYFFQVNMHLMIFVALLLHRLFF